MGNRAVITTKENFENNGVGVYLHWNGGRDSVEAFLKYCELKGYRSPSSDNYGWARLCQVIGNFFGGSTSIGIDLISKLDYDNWDNGTYIIENWKIVDRKCFAGLEQDSHNFKSMLKEIDKKQPKEEQLGSYLFAKEVPTSSLKLKDEVWIMDSIYGKPDCYTVVGFGTDEFRNGHNVKGVPYINKYDHNGDYSWNINNYIFEETVRLCED